MYFHTSIAGSNVFIWKLQWLDAAVLRIPGYSVSGVAAAFYSFSVHVMGERLMPFKGVAAVLRICVKNAQGGTSAKFACKCFNLDSGKTCFFKRSCPDFMQTNIGCENSNAIAVNPIGIFQTFGILQPWLKMLLNLWLNFNQTSNGALFL